eukprot:GHVQ01025938.1.p1 GENE.GHVQ01025938.1~~GHVQ01025938.1.p1  ORF type:complete len:143 (-),score=38.17 GHVQ01025938.1:530-958(-)
MPTQQRKHMQQQMAEQQLEQHHLQQLHQQPRSSQPINQTTENRDVSNLTPNRQSTHTSVMSHIPNKLQEPFSPPPPPPPLPPASSCTTSAAAHTAAEQMLQSYIFGGQRERQYGEAPEHMGGYTRIAPSPRWTHIQSLTKRM